MHGLCPFSEIPVLRGTDTVYTATYDTALSIYDDENSFFAGYVIDGKKERDTNMQRFASMK